MKVISPWYPLINTYPKDTIINIYSTDHTGPNNQDGGAHDGLLVFEYHSLESIVFCIVINDNIFYRGTDY